MFSLIVCYSHVLASGSVDETVLLWDMDNGTPVTKLSTFKEKVQSIKWHPSETQQLLTGCGDKYVLTGFKFYDRKYFSSRMDKLFFSKDL